eukprot:CAMPEP_0178446336 /NCGR_PEP_ID=MMETSP0689_2-20121128/40743_1 /TAXON_ID=160604 /ORGANISM="Amphidinium massartii, Strain CS-259" /LENGTH=70 /DNA_ID=CAMNT_0020071141 /DNA_START=29 /DNA_END=238 /DNA_ORIENTATION=+
MNSALLCLACLAGCSLPELASGACDDSKCNSNHNDCCAPAQLWESKTCSDAYEVHDLRQPCDGYSEGKYT